MSSCKIIIGISRSQQVGCIRLSISPLDTMHSPESFVTCLPTPVDMQILYFIVGEYNYLSDIFFYQTVGTLLCKELKLRVEPIPIVSYRYRQRALWNLYTLVIHRLPIACHLSNQRYAIYSGVDLRWCTMHMISTCIIHSLRNKRRSEPGSYVCAQARSWSSSAEPHGWLGTVSEIITIMSFSNRNIQCRDSVVSCDMTQTITGSAWVGLKLIPEAEGVGTVTHILTVSRTRIHLLSCRWVLVYNESEYNCWDINAVRGDIF